MRKSATQIKVAKVTGVTQSTVSGWERGIDLPVYGRLSSIALAYGIARPRLTALWLAQLGASEGAAAA